MLPKNKKERKERKKKKGKKYIRKDISESSWIPKSNAFGMLWVIKEKEACERQKRGGV